MKWISIVAAVVAASVAPASGAEAAIHIKIDMTSQQMSVDVDGKTQHVWPVSTAARDYVTPTGTFRPIRMHTMWYSKKYDNAPMPHAIFFSGGYAIHGTQSVRMLGRPASHGCVRLAPSAAATLYALVQKQGMAATRITLTGAPRHPAPAIAQRTAPAPRLAGAASAPTARMQTAALQPTVQASFLPLAGIFTYPGDRVSAGPSPAARTSWTVRPR